MTELNVLCNQLMPWDSLDELKKVIRNNKNSLEEVESYHVGVVTTDAYSPNIPGCQALSSLVVSTGGSSSSNRRGGQAGKIRASHSQFGDDNTRLANTGYLSQRS